MNFNLNFISASPPSSSSATTPTPSLLLVFTANTVGKTDFCLCQHLARPFSCSSAQIHHGYFTFGRISTRSHAGRDRNRAEMEYQTPLPSLHIISTVRTEPMANIPYITHAYYNITCITHMYYPMNSERVHAISWQYPILKFYF